MFDLNKAVDEWCQRVVRHGIWEAERVDELKDHLYCLIEAELGAGKTEAQAFERATQALGYPESDSARNVEHTRVIGRVCRMLARLEGRPNVDSPLLITHAIIWASVMLASAWILRGEQAGDDVLWILFMGWLASYFTIDGTKRSAKQEWACLKRKFTRAAR